MKIEYKLFEGQHCETNATGNLFSQQDINLSEPMLFGLGEGLGFIFLNLSSLNLPFVGGRSKPFELTQKLCGNLGVDLIHKETSSKKSALNSLQNLLSEKKCVGLQLDSFYLDYFTTKVHFAGHFVSAFGFDDKYFYLIDTKQQGSRQKCSQKNLEQARFAKGAMAAKARFWTVDVKNKQLDLKKAIPRAIRNNAKTYLNPPFKGASFHGIEKLAKSLPTWIEIAKKPKEDLALAALMMERAGTGGSIFRNFYRDFLIESYGILKSTEIKKGSSLFIDIAKQWGEVADLLEETSKTLNQKYLVQASELCRTLAITEVEAMKVLGAV
jgi:hypothetical protein